MSSPTAPPPAPPRRRSWIVPAAAAAGLLVLAGWLLAPALRGPLEAAGPAPAASTPHAPGAPTTAPARPPAPDPSPSATGAPPRPSTTSTSTSDVVGDTGELPPQEAWRPVAEGFARDFTVPGEDWAARLSAWTTPELAESYSWTDPNRQPTGTYQGLEVTTQDPTSVQARVTYAGAGDLVVDLQLLLTPDGWRVTSAAAADT